MPRPASSHRRTFRAGAIAAAALVAACAQGAPGRFAFALGPGALPSPAPTTAPGAWEEPAGGEAGVAPAATPTPGRNSHGGGGSGGAAATPAPVATGERTGRVLAAEAPFDPVGGVVIAAGAATATSAGDGTFALPGDPAGGLVALSAPGRATAVVAGWTGGALDLHLAAGEPAGGPAAGGLLWADVAGRVVDDAGAAVAGAQVTVAAVGALGAPVTTGADGRFRARVTGLPPAGAAATVWAVTLDGAGEVARFGSQAVTAGAEADAGDVAIAASTGAVTLPAPLMTAFPATAAWELDAVGAGGTTFTLARRAAGALTAPAFPGAGLEVRATATGADGHGTSFWRVAAAAGAIAPPAFLPPPTPAAPLSTAPGAAWAWAAAPGATGYRVEVRGADARERWEAFTAAPALTLPAGVPAAPATVRIVATTEGDLYALAGLRALRLFAPPARHAVWQGTVL